MRRGCAGCADAIRGGCTRPRARLRNGILPGCAAGVSLYGAGPDAVVGVLQGDAPPAEAEYELFAPAGAVFDAEQECHGIGLWEVLIATFFLRNKITK